MANTCSTDDEDRIREGIENVKNVLREHYVNPEESTLIQSKLKEHGKYKIIDKISVELDAQRDCYWANIVNSNIKKANIAKPNTIAKSLGRNMVKIESGAISI